MSTAAPVQSCTTTECAFNDGTCRAFAITVGGAAGKARCTTFITLDARGGVPGTLRRVGACQRLECVHNADLMCTAEGIEVSAGAECLTYQLR